MYPISLLNPMIWVTSLNPNQSPFFWRLNPTKSPFFHHHQSPWKITVFLNFPSGFPSHKHHWATDKPCEASLRDSSGISSMPALAAFSASVAVATACSVSWRQLEAAAAGGASLQMVVKYGEKHRKNHEKPSNMIVLSSSIPVATRKMMKHLVVDGVLWPRKAYNVVWNIMFRQSKLPTC